MWKEYRKDIQDVRGRLPDSELVVAKHDGTIVGAVTYYPRRNDPEGRPTDHSGVRLLAVAPSSRGKGIGRAADRRVHRPVPRERRGEFAAP